MNKRKIMIMMAGMVLPILAPQASAAAEHHDWEDQHVLSINREPARAAFMPYQAKKGDSQNGSSDGRRRRRNESWISIVLTIAARAGNRSRYQPTGR